jgi:hypothetical protein
MTHELSRLDTYMESQWMAHVEEFTEDMPKGEFRGRIIEQVLDVAIELNPRRPDVMHALDKLGAI